MRTRIYLVGEYDTVEIDNRRLSVTNGLRGFGIPTPVLRIDPSASNGGTFRYAKRDVREISLPLTIMDDEPDIVEAYLRRVSNIMQGKVKLVVESWGQPWYLECYYAGGGETTYGSTGTEKFVQWDIILRAPQPFWQSDTAFGVSIIKDSSTRGLLAGSSPKSLSKLRVKTSQSFGTVYIWNDGDRPAPAKWQINGPLTSITIAGDDGVGFTYSASLSSSDKLYIDCEAGTVVDQNGVNKYSGLAAAPKFFAIPPGTRAIQVTVSGATSATKVNGIFGLRREVLH